MSVATAFSESTAVRVPAGTWEVDPSHSSVEFQVKHMMIATVKGRFTDFEGTLESSEDGSLKAHGTIQVESLDTYEPNRDEHLRSPDFFDAANYPQIRFASTQIVPTGGTSLWIIGDLTIKGRTRPVVLTGELGGVGVDPWGNERVGLVARGNINREDFDLTWHQALQTGDALVGDWVKIEVDISAVKLAEQ